MVIVGVMGGPRPVSRMTSAWRVNERHEIRNVVLTLSAFPIAGVGYALQLILPLACCSCLGLWGSIRVERMYSGTFVRVCFCDAVELFSDRHRRGVGRVGL